MKNRLIKNTLKMFSRSLIITLFIISGCSKAENKDDNIAYYTCSMHPSVHVSVEDYNNGDTKCPICNMDLIPVFKSSIEDTSTNTRQIVNKDTLIGATNKTIQNASTLRITKRGVILAGVRTSTAEYRNIKKIIQTPGTLEYDETKVAYVSANISGRLDKIFVNFKGASVKKGEKLAQVYSPELISTQEEYISATKNKDNQLSKSLGASARKRLLLWGISKKEIQEIRKKGKPKLHMTIVSPINGIVVNKEIIEGQYIKTGQPLYHIVDLSKLWMKAVVYENEIAFVRQGQEVKIEAIAYPGKKFHGRIAFLDPMLDPMTHTITLRVEIDNYSGMLKPGMYVTAEVISDLGKKLTIPNATIIDTGVRKIVYKKIADRDDYGIFQGILVETGIFNDTYTEVLKGIKKHDRVVTEGAFLIDSQAQLTGVEAAAFGGSLSVDSK